MRVPLQGAAKIFEAGLKSKTWDIHGMPQFITMTHCEGCETYDMYALHIVKASESLTVEIPSREVEKAFWIAWLNIVHHIEDEASSESDKKVEWYSDCHDSLTDDIRMMDNKASTERDRRQKLAQANSKIRELETKLTELQQELTALWMQDKRIRLFGTINTGSQVLIQNPLLANQARKGRRARHSHQPSAMGASSWVKPVCQYWLMNWCRWCWHRHHRQWGLRPHCPRWTHPHQGSCLHGGRVTLQFW